MARSTTTAGLLLLSLALVPTGARAGTLIDSFTTALPPNYWLPNTQRPILFVGTECDGANCPPASTVTYSDDQTWVDQSGVPGTISPWRSIGLARTHHDPADHGVLRIDPANGGSLILEGITGGGLQIPQRWGDFFDHPLNLDLTADGSDHFEIDVLEASFLPEAPHIQIGMYGSAFPNTPAYRDWAILGPGTISVGYDGFTDLAPIIHDVDVIHINYEIPAGTWPRLVLGEFRTANTPSPTVPQTWGRIKDAYRR